MKIPEKIEDIASYWQSEYKQQMLNFIADYEEYVPGSFFTPAKKIKNPSAGEAEWNAKYPNGIDSWIEKKVYIRIIPYTNRQNAIYDCLAEIDKRLNALESSKKKTPPSRG